MENSSGSGDPDVDGCYQGDVFFVELKGCNRPTNGGALDFEVRISQKLWHRHHWRAGGNCWFYIRVGKDREVCRYLIPGDKGDVLYEGTSERLLSSLAVLPSNHTPLDFLTVVRKRSHS